MIKGRQLITYNLDWSVPYRVSNFLYLTSPEVRYVLVGDAGELEDDLPDIMNIEVVEEDHIADVEDKNNYKIKFISFDIGFDDKFIPSHLQSMLDKDISAIKISDDKIQFYKKEEDKFVKEGNPIDYLTDEEKIGAVFAEDFKQYKCAKDKALEKFDIVTAIYQKRIDLIETILTGTCKGLFRGLKTTNALPTGLNHISEVETLNQRLQDYSCPTIY